MSTTIFSNAYKGTDTITAQGAVMKWGTGSSSSASHFPILVNQVQIQYSRNVLPINPINTDKNGTYKKIQLVGAPSGVFTANGILTRDASSLANFLRLAGRGCVSDKDQLFITLRPFAGESCTSSLVYRMEGVILASLAVTLTEGQGGITVVNQPLTFQFTTLTMTGADDTKS